jgi:protoheme IX farnesyltransferase
LSSKFLCVIFFKNHIEYINQKHKYNQQIMSEKTLGAGVFPSITLSKIKDFITLTKPRLLSSVLFSTVLGYVLPQNSVITVLPLLYLLSGTALTGGGAHVLNQWMEQVPDSKMSRTKSRPLPMGRLSRNEALIFGVIISITGIMILWLTLNALTAALGLLTVISYILIYTPLKQKTIANTWFGGITGALPPVMGWTAARGQLDWEVLPIFALLYFWQLPHFFAIAWMYREDYQRGGLQNRSKNGSTYAVKHSFAICGQPLSLSNWSGETPLSHRRYSSWFRIFCSNHFIFS